MQFLLRDVLEAEGHVVQQAGNGRKGLHMARIASPDLVITDLLMPESDGLEVTMALHRKFPATRIIAVSGGVGDMDFLDVAKEFGAHRILRKPLTMADLLNAVEEELEIGSRSPTGNALHRISGSQAKESIAVLLVDDHEPVRQALRSILEGYPDVVVIGEASNGREAIEAVEMLQPTIVVMDINMPVMNGIEATTQIKAHHPDILVIGLPVTMQREVHSAMIQAGAEVLIPKEAAYEQLHSAIKVAVQGI